MFPARATLSFAVSLPEEGQVELLARRPTDLARRDTASDRQTTSILFLRIAASGSMNAISFSSACTTKRLPSPRCASAIRSFDFEEFDDMENKLKEQLPLPRIFGMNKALVKLAKPHLRVLLTIAASVAPLNFTKADTLTAEEQALVNKGAVMEMLQTRRAQSPFHCSY